MNYMEAVFAPAEAVYQRGVVHDTFGHLAPTPTTVYTGFILFTHTCHGDIVAIDYNFTDPQGRELSGSPWLCEDVTEFIGNKVLPPRALKCRLPEGGIYRFVGTYTRSPDRPKWKGSNIMIEGKARFRGRVQRVKIPCPKF